MSMAKAVEISKALSKAAIRAGADFDEQGVAAFCEILIEYDLADILRALDRVGRECKGRFAVADILNRIDLGYEGPEQAWARIPRSERESTVWTVAHQRAHAVASPLLEEGDAVAARMAFREAYNREVEAAKAERKPARWFLSEGWDVEGRVRAVEDAVAGGLLPAPSAVKLLPASLTVTESGRLERIEHVKTATAEPRQAIAVVRQALAERGDTLRPKPSASSADKEVGL